MFSNIRKLIPSSVLGGSENQETTKGNGLKAGSTTAAASKRRALGDITNATNGETSRGNAKKLQVGGGGEEKEDYTKNESKAHDFSNRSYMQRPADDIDFRDIDNPVLCTSYVNDMYKIFNIMERQVAVDSNYMSSQKYLNVSMRAILVDWLVEVHLKFKLVPETLYLAVNLVDRYLEKKEVKRTKLQLVGVAALLLSSKYEEIYAPEIRDLVCVTDRAFSKQEIVQMESDIVKTLEYNLTVPTIHSFLCRYLKAAHADRTMVQLSCYIAERSIQEYSMVKFLPSKVAATSVLIARKSLGRHPWSPTLVKYTNYDECDLENCAREMNTYMSESSASKQQAVFKKYSSDRFGSASKLPLSFN